MLLALCAGCGQAPPEALEASHQAVVFGQPSEVEDDGVVHLWTVAPDNSIGKCSGSLVADNLVLTARHCVAAIIDQPYACTASGELTPDSKGGKVGASVDPKLISVRVGAHPDGTVAALGAQIFASQAPTLCRNDIALVLLDRKLSALPIMPLRLHSGVSPGDHVRVIGYGLDENGHFGVRNSHGGVTLSKVGASSFRPAGDGVAARMIMTLGPSGCQGDSGGPAVSQQNAIVGIFSAVVGACTDPAAQGYFTQVAPFYDELLKPAFAAAEAEPTLEVGGPDAAGGAGTGGAPGDAGASAGAGVIASAGAGASAGAEQDASGAGGPSQEPADSGADAAPEYHLPRKSGGCKCRMSERSESNTDPEPVLASMVVLFWLARRRRPQFRCLTR